MVGFDNRCSPLEASRPHGDGSRVGRRFRAAVLI